MKTIRDFILVFAVGLGFAYLFIYGWDLDSQMRERSPWSKPAAAQGVR